MFDAYKAAEIAIMSGQEYRIGGRLVRRAELSTIQSGRQEWKVRLDRLQSGGGGIKLQFPDLAG